MNITEKDLEELTRKALALANEHRQRKSVLEPYRDWIREMIEDKGITFRIVTRVLQTECGLRISEQSLNEWYRRHFDQPLRAPKKSTRELRLRASAPDTDAAPELPLDTPPARPGRPRKQPAPNPAPKPAKPNLSFNSPDDWKIV